MRIGVIFPHLETGTDPAAIRDYAQGIEAMGFTHLLAFDHVVGADPDRPGGFAGGYNMRTPFREPLVTFSYMAGVTTTLEFTTGVIVLPQRQTALFAKQVADLDLLSGGRLRIGIGTGWNAVEYEALGQDFGTRGAREAEQVRLLRKFWDEEIVTFNGKFDTVTLAGINPRPLRSIPIWFGGRSEVIFRRMARLGDGWICLEPPDDKLRASLDRIHTEITADGRDPSGFGLEGQVNITTGDPERWARHVDSWRTFGASHLSIRTMPHISEPRQGVTVGDHLALLRRFREVVPA